jgi:hypothetical protein
MAHNSALLAAETEAIVKQFEYTDDDVNKGVK